MNFSLSTTNRGRLVRAIVAIALALAASASGIPAQAQTSGGGTGGGSTSTADDDDYEDPISGCTASPESIDMTCFLKFFFEVQTGNTMSVMEEAEGGVMTFFDEAISASEDVIATAQEGFGLGNALDGISFTPDGVFDMGSFVGGSPIEVPVPDFNTMFADLIGVDEFGCPINGGGPTAAAAADTMLILMEFLYEILPKDVLTFEAAAIAAIPVAFAKLPPVIIGMQNDMNDNCHEGTHQEFMRADAEARLRADIAATLASSSNPVAEFLLPTSLGGRLAWHAHGSEGSGGDGTAQLPEGIEPTDPGSCADGSRCPGQFGETSPTVQNVVANAIADLQAAGIPVSSAATTSLQRADDALAEDNYLAAFRYYRQAYGYATRL